MAIKKHFYIIAVLSVLFTLVIQLDLTKAIIFDDYLSTRQISGVNYYLSLINESSKGNWQLGSPYLSEWRFQPYLYPALNINAAGLVKRAFSLDIKTYALLMGYLAIFVLVFLLITAFLNIFNFHYFGYLAATFYIFYPRHIEWQRTLSPEINFIPLALFLVFYFSRWKFWIREVGLGILTGALFYFYPYYWTFVLALIGMSDLWEFWRQRKIIWMHLYKYLIIAVLAPWYLAHLWQLHQLPYYKESIIRIGALYSRFPAGLYTQAVLLASLAIFYFFKKYFARQLADSGFKENLDKIAAGLLASLAVLNQQAVTGMQLEFNSHYLPVILLFLAAFWSRLVFVLIKAGSFYKKILIIFAFLISIGAIANKIYIVSGPAYQKNYVGGRADEVVNWFLENKIRDKVVYAPEDLGDDINLWTDNYLYFHPGQELQLMPTAEIIDRFTYFDIANRNITDHLLESQTMVFGMTFIEKMQKDNLINKLKSLASGKKFAPADLAQSTEYDFEPIYRKRNNPDLAEFTRYLKKYNVNYLVYRQKDRDSIYSAVSGKIVFEDKDFIIK